MRVLIIPEDPTLDQYILKPIVERIFADLGRSARIDVLVDSFLTGAAEALDATVIDDVLQDYRMIDLFLLMVDRDCDRKNHTAKAAQRQAEHPNKLIAVVAWQEIEVWALALHRDALAHKWPEVRAHCDPKEAYFDALVVEQKWLTTVGKGRKRAMRELGAGWKGFNTLCPEIDALKKQIAAWLAARA